MTAMFWDVRKEFCVANNISYIIHDEITEIHKYIINNIRKKRNK